MTIAEFILLRIAEDEEAARAATPGPWVEGVKRAGSPGKWRGVEAYSVLADRPERLLVEGLPVVADSPSASDTAHIARHDPARVLAECASKRAQIEHLIRFMEGDYAPWNEDQLRMMAAPYSDHPDFDESWRP